MTSISDLGRNPGSMIELLDMIASVLDHVLPDVHLSFGALIEDIIMETDGTGVCETTKAALLKWSFGLFETPDAYFRFRRARPRFLLGVIRDFCTGGLHVSTNRQQQSQQKLSSES